jgi:hypothetical protein
MRRRITALLVGAAVLGTTFIVGPQAAVAEPSKVDRVHKAAQPSNACRAQTPSKVFKPVKGRTTDQNRTWSLRVRTGSGAEAGTDANVWLRLFGSGRHDLYVPSHGRLLDPDRWVWSEYHCQAPDLGPITSVWVWVDDAGASPNFFLDTIEILSPFTERWTVWKYNRWLIPNAWNMPTSRES